jgi:hypothetical protein
MESMGPRSYIPKLAVSVITLINRVGRISAVVNAALDEFSDIHTRSALIGTLCTPYSGNIDGRAPVMRLVRADPGTDSDCRTHAT